MNLIPEKYRKAGIFPIGRLDKDTEGLILLTNDGEISNILMHPRYDSTKEYIVTLDRELTEKDKNSIEKGISFRDFRAKPSIIFFMDDAKKTIKMIIKEGKKRQIRVTFIKLQYKVLKLKRIAIGPIKLGSMNKGHHRLLNKTEIKTLKKYAEGMKSTTVIPRKRRRNAG